MLLDNASDIWCARSDFMRGEARHRGTILGEWLPGARCLEVKMYVKARWGRESVRCSEFRGGRFSEVANVLHKRDFRSVIATLSAVGSVSASRSVRSGRFYCIAHV